MCHTLCGIGRRIADDDSLFAAGIQINIVIAGSCLTNQLDTVWKLLNQCFGKLQLLTDYDFTALNTLQNLLGITVLIGYNLTLYTAGIQLMIIIDSCNI